MNRMTFLVERFSLTRRRFAMARQALSLTRSRPLSRLLRNLWLCQVLFAVSQTAQISENLNAKSRSNNSPSPLALSRMERENRRQTLDDSATLVIGRTNAI
jgi:hypothetical protein